MSRVKIKFPANNPVFSCSIPVRIGDVNYGGHVGNDAILSIVHEARMQMLANQGHTELDVDGVGLIMADVAIAYKGESFYKDVLFIDIYAVELTAVSFDLLYNMYKVENGNEKPIAHAKTGMICFDYDLRKITSMPETFKSKLERV